MDKFLKSFAMLVLVGFVSVSANEFSKQSTDDNANDTKQSYNSSNESSKKSNTDSNDNYCHCKQYFKCCIKIS